MLTALPQFWQFYFLCLFVLLKHCFNTMEFHATIKQVKSLSCYKTRFDKTVLNFHWSGYYAVLPSFYGLRSFWTGIVFWKRIINKFEVSKYLNLYLHSHKRQCYFAYRLNPFWFHGNPSVFLSLFIEFLNLGKIQSPVRYCFMVYRV